MARRKYRNPPIEEAVCDFRFAPSVDWDPTLPGLLFEKLKQTYNEKPRTQSVIEPPGGGVGLSAVSAAAQATLVQRVQFLGDEGTRIVGVSADHLSVHMLRPYTNWEDFRPRILSAVDAYKKIARPEGINRFGLRYVNRITIDTETPDLGLYFSEPPIFPVFKHPARMTGFLERKEATFSDKPIRAVVTFADMALNQPNTANYLLDVDVLWTLIDRPFPSTKIGKTLDELKERHRDVFESLITDGARKLFDAR